MKAFVVTVGSYSDYRIIGVFLDRDKADVVRVLHSSEHEDAGIEEYEVDEVPDYPVGRLPFRVAMREDGSTTEIGRTSLGWFADGWTPHRDDAVVFEVWAEDEQHAVKIANERRIRLIASGEWTTDWSVWKQRQIARGG